MPASHQPLRIAYAVQNVGINLAEEVGDAVPVKYTLHGLRQAGHSVSYLSLVGRSVLGVDDPSLLHLSWSAPLGLSGKRPFLFCESGVRRVQRELRLPYFALFDSYRFYEACCRILPRYSLCHEHNGLFSIGAALACRRLNIPYLLTFSADAIMELALVGRPLRGLHAYVAAWAAKLTYQAAHKIICVSSPAKQHLIEKWQVAADKIAIMPNGVDIARFGQRHDEPALRQCLGLTDEPIVMFVGGFQAWHGVELLVASFAQVRRQIPQARLLLVGDGPARPSIEQRIAECGLGEAVVITGMIPHEDVPAYLALADVATLPYPSLPQELWFSPLKLYEYMAAGKAIVASRAGQIAEVIEDGRNGLLVEPGNVAALAEALICLLQNEAERRRLGQRAQQQAVQQHSWGRYIERLEEIYRSIL